MHKIEWSESFSVGVKTLDDQHKTLIAMINALIDASDGEDASDVLSASIASMIEYAATHFDEEERLMLEYDYPDYETQRRQHGEFIAKTGEFIERTAKFGADGGLHVSSISDEALDYLQEWWLHHILEEDMEYKSFFKKKNVA
jgi:hemerythrin|tara:strand:- start:2547 stop:2975 length:429 start_codon:yes stop_codon:yes gene_type:complete